MAFGFPLRVGSFQQRMPWSLEGKRGRASGCIQCQFIDLNYDAVGHELGGTKLKERMDEDRGY